MIKRTLFGVTSTQLLIVMSIVETAVTVAAIMIMGYLRFGVVEIIIYGSIVFVVAGWVGIQFAKKLAWVYNNAP